MFFFLNQFCGVARTSVLPYLGIILSDLTKSTLEKLFLLRGNVLVKYNDGRQMPLVSPFFTFVDEFPNEVVMGLIGLGYPRMIGRAPSESERW